MPCLTPYRGDTSQMLLFKIASCLEASGAAGAAVLSFNGRTGDVILTLADVAAVADDIYVNESGDTMTGPLNMTAGQSYQYDSVNVIRAQTALDNYFFGPSGNLTMTGTNTLAVGEGALLSNTTGSFNTALGSPALGANTTGFANVAVGVNALGSNTTGANNSALGVNALFSNTTGTDNFALGSNALTANTTGFNNSAIGSGSLFNVTTGIQNTAVGYNTGLGITTGGNNTILGANVTGLAAALSNNIILADGAGVIRIQVDSTGAVSIPIGLFIGTAPIGGYSFGVLGDTRLIGNVFYSAPFQFLDASGAGYGFTSDVVNGLAFFSNSASARLIIQTTGDILIPTAGRLEFQSGANQRAGDAVLVAGTVTVANTTVSANTLVFLTRRVTGGTIGFAVTYTTIAATSFTITSDNVLDTSTYSYLLIEVP